MTDPREPRSVEPLSAEELAELRRNHVASGSPWFASSKLKVCGASNCNQWWPCDAARLLALLDAERAAARESAGAGLDVEALAAAIQTTILTSPGEYTGPGMGAYRSPWSGLTDAQKRHVLGDAEALAAEYNRLTAARTAIGEEP